MQGSETYETLASSFQKVFREINEVQEDGFIEFDDERVPVLLYLGGDNKVSKHLDYIWSTNIIILLVWFKWQLALTVHVYSFRSAPILHVLLTMHNSRDKMI